VCARRDVPETIEKMAALSEFRPLWIEEPTNCDDVIGHRVIQKHLNQLANPVGVATRADNSRGPGGPMGPLRTPLRTSGTLSRPSITH
jgi:hypothetical protein